MKAIQPFLFQIFPGSMKVLDWKLLEAEICLNFKTFKFNLSSIMAAENCHAWITVDELNVIPRTIYLPNFIACDTKFIIISYALENTNEDENNCDGSIVVSY